MSASAKEPPDSTSIGTETTSSPLEGSSGFSWAGTPATLPSEVSFALGSHGKPYLAEDTAGLQFNLSHSHRLGLLAVTLGRELGVDVEYLDREISVADIARRFFSERESENLLSLPSSSQPLGFFHCWTRKEAFLKAKGMGIAFGLDQFSVSLHPQEKVKLLETPYCPGDAREWSIIHLEPARGYVGALAVQGPASSVRNWRFELK